MTLNPSRMTLLVVILLAVGCQRDSQPMAASPGPEPVTSEAPQQAPLPVADVQPPGKSVAIPAGKGAKGKEVLQQDQEISGSLGSPEAGALIGIGVKIGTYSNRPPALHSDGSLTVKVCVRDSCSTGAANLMNAKDNDLLDFNLDNQIQVAMNDTITYTVRKISGSNSVVIWTFPLRAGQAGFVDADGVEASMSPRISLRYSND